MYYYNNSACGFYRKLPGYTYFLPKCKMSSWYPVPAAGSTRALLVLVPAVGPPVSGYQLQDPAAGTYPVPWYCIINVSLLKPYNTHVIMTICRVLKY